MRRIMLLLLALFAAALAPQAARAARIVVTIDGLHSGKGNVYVALFSRAEEFPDGDHSDQHLQVKASTSPITVAFDVPPGRYALGAYHDENGNGKLDTNFIGYPIEGYALSNGIRAVVSRPRFVDAAFEVAAEGRMVALHIRY